MQFLLIRSCSNTLSLCAHPDLEFVSANLAKVVILASMAQFIQHLGTVYGLIDFFRKNPGEIQIP